MEIKDYVKQFFAKQSDKVERRDLQKSHKKVRVADFCRENMLDYYEMVEALKQDKFESESYESQVQCGDLVITEIPDSNEATQPKPSTEGYIKEVMLSFPKGLRLTVREITPSDLMTRAGLLANPPRIPGRKVVLLSAIPWRRPCSASYKNLADEERQEQRAIDIIPILNDMHQDLLYYANTATAKCGELLMKAINYAKAEWKGLIKYTEEGKYRVDNNAAESIMRDLACGRKNFLFCGSDNAAKNLAFAYSLTESCKLNNINPYDYWSDLIDFIGCELLEQRRHTKAGFQFAES